MVKLDTQYRPPAFDPSRYDAHRVDWLGRTVAPFIVVTSRLVDSPDGLRQWQARCLRCKREYCLTDRQLESPHRTICGCRTVR